MALDWQRLKNELLLQRRQLLIAVSVFIAAVSALLFGAIPLWQNISIERGLLTQNQANLDQLQRRATLLSSLTAEDKKQFLAVEEALPSQKQPVQVLQVLQAMAAETKTTISSYDLNPGVISTESARTSGGTAGSSAGSTTRFLILKLELHGTFPQITDFVQDMETSRPLLEITGITIDPGRRQTADSGLSADYVAQLEIHSYYGSVDIQKVAGGSAAPLTPDQQKILDQVLTYRYWGPTGTSTAQPGVYNNNDLFGLGTGATAPAATPEPTPEPQQ